MSGVFNFDLFTTDMLYPVNSRLRGFTHANVWPENFLDGSRSVMLDQLPTPAHMEKALQYAFAWAEGEGLLGRSCGAIAYRTVWLPEWRVESLRPGELYIDPGYSCAATTEEDAKEHLLEEFKESKRVPVDNTVPVMFTIKLGYSAILLPGEGDEDPAGFRNIRGNISSQPRGQYVLDRGSKLRITDVNRDDNLTVFTSEQVR